MDNSRDADLKALYERFNDPTISRAKRIAAHRAFESIQAKVKDRTLVRMRERLVKAHRANDTEEIEKIEQLVREYSRRKGWSYQ